MPTTFSRAKRWIKSRKATPFWKKGVFCVRLNVKTLENKQEIAIGVDPGTMREAYTVKSAAHTYINIQTVALTGVTEALARRRKARQRRRYRHTPYRKCRASRNMPRLAPSIRARLQWKLRIIAWLKRLFPITIIVIEDIKAATKGHRHWDRSFSCLQIGKHWFYKQLPELQLRQGYETKNMRDKAGLKKTTHKLSNSFSAHCVDSWVLASSAVGGHMVPDNMSMLLIEPMRWHRRQLHIFQFKKGGRRRMYGGTRSLGFKRGSLIRHPTYGLTYVGGTSNGRISLHDVASGKLLSHRIHPEHCQFKTYLAWRYKYAT